MDSKLTIASLLCLIDIHYMSNIRQIRKAVIYDVSDLYDLQWLLLFGVVTVFGVS